MYVGPWQEFKLMRAIQDLREELDQQQTIIERQQQQQQQQDENSKAGSSLPTVAQRENERLSSTRRAKPPFRVYETTSLDSKQSCAYCDRDSASGPERVHDSTVETSPFASEVRPESYHDYKIKDLKEPTYGKKEGALLEGLSYDRHLPPLALSAPASQLPPTKEPTRRIPLDTDAISARVSQKVYNRYVHEAGKALSCPPSSRSTAMSGYRGGASSRSRSNGGEDAKRKKLIERKMRLQALYRSDDTYEGIGTEREEEEEEEEEVECGLKRENSRTLGPESMGEPETAPHEPPVVHVAPEDLFGHSRPPPPQEIDDDDIGGLVDWANNLNDAWLDDI